MADRVASAFKHQPPCNDRLLQYVYQLHALVRTSHAQYHLLCCHVTPENLRRTRTKECSVCAGCAASQSLRMCAVFDTLHTMRLLSTQRLSLLPRRRRAAERPTRCPPLSALLLTIGKASCRETLIHEF